MSLFQTSVIKKYLSELSSELIDKKYKEFQSYFGNAERQENIRNSKEEEYQSGFITALFVNILGYTLNPEPNFNIVLEKKNVDDSKKADGAILKENEVIAVIELKSTQTTDLGKVETQAFGYKHHNPKCQYIITSNFEKIRLYIQNAVDHLEFDLFNLTREDFALLWLCFEKDNILKDIPLKIKESSVLQEENVTKQLYNDYSKFRKDIFDNIVKNNPEFDKLVLFKKTQKLLDRFLFIFFAEDRLLLPPNSISEIVKQWNDLKENYDEYFPLYERFKKYFGYLNTGFKGKKYDIFAYNGGLFLPDEILDNIKVDDEVLYQNTIQLSKYDFETDVDVNILGHIFEHSLGEIETVQAEIEGKEIDTQKTKRKKDGIFYTPKYITKYIVENTVGKLCEEKRAEIGIIDEEYAKGRRNRKKEIVKDLDNKLTEYREWLLNITILDPACGSGAFLNQALEFLIEEHKKIDELKAQLLGGSIVFSDIEAKILEKNIYGVDLNEESVEIAKLSLWLRTAQKGRKLTT
jgi:type I restriction-modification system DNA methylase subunit